MIESVPAVAGLALLILPFPLSALLLWFGFRNLRRAWGLRSEPYLVGVETHLLRDHVDDGWPPGAGRWPAPKNRHRSELDHPDRRRAYAALAEARARELELYSKATLLVSSAMLGVALSATFGWLVRVDFSPFTRGEASGYFWSLGISGLIALVIALALALKSRVDWLRNLSVKYYDYIPDRDGDTCDKAGRHSRLRSFCVVLLLLAVRAFAKQKR